MNKQLEESNLFCACALTDNTGETTTKSMNLQADVQMDNLINSVPGGIAIYRIGSIFETLYFNDGVCSLSGHTREEYAKWIHDDAMVAVFCEDRQRVMAEIMTSVKTGRMVDISYRINHKSGTPVWVHLSGVKIRDDDYGPIYHAVFIDISKDRQALDLMLERAEHDELTGLYNRAGFKSVLHNFFALNSQASAVFVMLDIDNFKSINDTYGHTKGDEILCEIADALQNYAAEGDVIARIGGDEFIVFLPREHTEAELIESLNRLCSATKIESSDGVVNISISCSMGACLAPQDGTNFDMLYGNADKALFATKRIQKGCYQMYSDNMLSPTPILAQNMDWILDESADGVFICNADTYELLYFNRAAKEMCDPKCFMPIGKPCYKVLMRRDSPCSFCHIGNIGKGDFLEREFTPEGTDLMLYMKGKLIDWNGISAHIEFIQDNTNRMRLERQIKISEERFSSTVSMSDISVWEYDFATKTIQQSVHSSRCEGGADYIENVPQSLIDSKHYHPESEKEACAIFERLIAGERVVEAELLVRDEKENSYWWERVRYSTVYDNDGKPLKAIAIGKDITMEKCREGR